VTLAEIVENRAFTPATATVSSMPCRPISRI
jgi:hypothetical protein